MGAFLLVVSFILLGMQLTVGAWLMRCWPALGYKWPLLLSLLGTLVIVWGFTGTRTNYSWPFHTLYYISYIYLGLVFLAFFWAVGWFVLLMLLKSFHVKTFWLGSVSLVTLFLVYILAFWGGFRSPKTQKIALQIPGAPTFKIALLSDTHLGMGVSVRRFKQVMDRIDAQKPDVLFILGDLFEYGAHRQQYALRLSQTRPVLGTYGVLGNHEYYVGYGKSKDFYHQAGITLLENEAAALPNGVQVAGLKDIKTAGVTPQDVAAVLAKADKNKPTILLSHTPLHAEVAAQNGAALMLSGHTHNGQLWPFHYLVKLQYPRVYGLYNVENMKFYITSGVFYWGIPLRFLAPAELVFIEVNA